MDQNSLSAVELNQQYIDDYYEAGMFDHLQDPVRFANLMGKRHWIHTEFYKTGITGLEKWYGDKADRQYDEWFDFLDRMLKVTDSMYQSFWEPLDDISAEIVDKRYRNRFYIGDINE